MKTTVILVPLLFSAFAAAQPVRLAWNRTNASSDIAMDTARTAIVDSQGRFVVAGATKRTNGKRVASITVFSRNRAVLDYAEIAPTGDASLEATHLMEDEGIFYLFCRRTETVDNDETITIHAFDSQLNELRSNSFTATAAPGLERVTAGFFDEADALFGLGLATAGTQYRTFLTKIDPLTLEPALIEIPNLASSPVASSFVLTSDGTIAVGKGKGTRAEIRGYTRNLAAKWSLDAADAQTVTSSISNVATGSGFIYVSMAKNQPTETHWLVVKINPANGFVSGTIDFPPFPGQNRVKPGPLAVNATGVYASFNIDGKSVIRRLDSNLAPQGEYQSSGPAVPRSLLVDKFGEIFATTQLAAPKILGAFKLNASLAVRFAHNQTNMQFDLPIYEQGTVPHPASGDILAWETDDDHGFRLSCYQQSPIAITDGPYRPKRNIRFRPPVSVFENDRYTDGAKIEIIQPPAHGSLTMGANGFFSYTSIGPYTGSDGFRYRLSKPGLSSTEANVNLIVGP